MVRFLCPNNESGGRVLHPLKLAPSGGRQSGIERIAEIQSRYDLPLDKVSQSTFINEIPHTRYSVKLEVGCFTNCVYLLLQVKVCVEHHTEISDVITRCY